MDSAATPFRITRHLGLIILFVFLLALVPAPLLLAATGNFIWARSMGGTLADVGNGVAVDSAGNVYATGSFTGTADFDPGSGTFNLTSMGSEDIFISKSDSGGNFIWARSMGGTANDQGRGIAVDSAGNIYTTGYFQGTVDFDPGPAIQDITSHGSTDIFVSKLDGGGNFVWARSMGGTAADQGRGIAVDSGGNVCTTGHFEGLVDFRPGPGFFFLLSQGAKDIFVSKLDNNGDFVWAGGMGGTSSDYGMGIAVDSGGNVYTTGHFFSETVDLKPGPETFELFSHGESDIFVSKLDGGGNFVWAGIMGGTSQDNGTGIAIDSRGNVHTTGSFSETADFDPGPGTFNLSSRGFGDIFVHKLDSSGNMLWARSMGGTDWDGGSAITVDSGGNVYTAGDFEGSGDFNPGSGTVNLTSRGSYDIFVSKLDSRGNFAWVRSMGGTAGDGGSGIAVDSGGDVYTAGFFMETVDFDPGSGTFNLTSMGSEDIFINKLFGPFSWPMFLPAITNKAHP